jgi:hypothetical protein
MDLLKSLQEINTVYTVFQEDQVLTHDFLNELSAYFEDQTRLTRVNLLGVGVACGLRPAVQGNNVIITPGVGVTTDGDLLYLAENTVFDKFKLYDDANPHYSPFYATESLIPLYELVRLNDTDETAAALSTFADTGNSLDNMAAVLLMENYLKPKDICTGTECDNLGQKCLNTIKVLLGERSIIKSLLDAQITPSLVSAPQPLVINRLILPPGLTGLGQFAKQYLLACQSLYARLTEALKNFFSENAALLADIYPQDPYLTRWQKGLEILLAKFSESPVGIQYFFDFLKDLAETYNQFCDLLCGERTWCCPNFEAFPKHLLLGNCVPGAAPDDNRTHFYPSPLLSRTPEHLDHARFLARKLDVLIQTFEVPAAAKDIRITPSFFEDQPLEDRAIPYYYQLTEEYQIHRHWNYRLSQRGLEAYNYSFNADVYHAQGSAANPLAAQIGRFSFFRIEGHLGKDVSTVGEYLEKLIMEQNLPFTVGAVMLGNDRTKIVKKPGLRYTDLHRFHYLLRQDISQQLDHVVNFAGNLTKEVDANLNILGEAEAVTYRNQARVQHQAIVDQADKTRPKLTAKYSEYKKFSGEQSWLPDVKQTIQVAGDFKLNLGPVSKTEFPSPVDAFISSPHLRWLDLLDKIIVQRDQQEDEKLLFSSFRSRHPGLDHFGGVLRGGTFLLVYDSDNHVIADFMLPYYCDDVTTPEVEEPQLDKPNLIPDLILHKPVTLIPSREKFFTGRLETFKVELKPQFETQEKSFQVFKDSIDTMTKVFTSVSPDRGKTVLPGTFQDPKLADYTRNLNEKQIVIKYLREQIKPDTPAEQRTLLQKQIDATEMETAGIANEATDYLNTSGAAVSLGTEGHAALVEVNNSISSLQGARAISSVNTNLERVANETRNSNLKVTLPTMIIRR